MKSYTLVNGILNRLPIFGRTFVLASNKELFCPKLDNLQLKESEPPLPTTTN